MGGDTTHAWQVAERPAGWIQVRRMRIRPPRWRIWPPSGQIGREAATARRLDLASSSRQWRRISAKELAVAATAAMACMSARLGRENSRRRHRRDSDLRRRWWQLGGPAGVVVAVRWRWRRHRRRATTGCGDRGGPYLAERRSRWQRGYGGCGGKPRAWLPMAAAAVTVAAGGGYQRRMVMAAATRQVVATVAKVGGGMAASNS